MDQSQEVALTSRPVVPLFSKDGSGTKRPVDFVLSARDADGVMTPVLYLSSDGELIADPAVPGKELIQMVLGNFEKYLQTKLDDSGSAACRAVLIRGEDQNTWLSHELGRIENLTYFVGGSAFVLALCFLVMLVTRLSKRHEEPTGFDEDLFK